MTANSLLHTLAKRRPSNSLRNASKQFYLFVVTTLACFVFGLIIWPSPITGYVAVSRVEFDCSASEFASPPREVDVHRALEPNCLPQHILERIDHLRSYVTVRSAISSGERSAYDIRFVGTTRQEATQFANAVARHVSELSNTQDGSQPILVRNAQSALQQARSVENDLQRELASLISSQRMRLEGHIRQARTTAVQISNVQDAGSVTHVESEPAAPAPPLNPQWQRLNLEYRDATDYIEKLRVNHTDDHPLVQSAMLQVEQLRTRLAATPRLLQPQAEGRRSAPIRPPRVLVTPRSERNQRDVVSLPSSEIQHGLDDMSRLVQSIRQATLARVAAEDDFIRCLAVPRGSHTRVTTTPARIVASIGGIPTLPRLAQALLFSVALGGLLAFFAGKALSSKVLRDARDIMQQLDLPVVTSLSIDDKRASFALRLLQRTALKTTRLCEVALFALVVFIALVALTDSRIAEGLLNAPFQAFSEIFERYRL